MVACQVARVCLVCRACQAAHLEECSLEAPPVLRAGVSRHLLPLAAWVAEVARVMMPVAHLTDGPAQMMVTTHKPPVLVDLPHSHPLEPQQAQVVLKVRLARLPVCSPVAPQ